MCIIMVNGYEKIFVINHDSLWASKSNSNTATNVVADWFKLCYKCLRLVFEELKTIDLLIDKALLTKNVLFLD